jgi:predicted ester cyclase
MPGVGCKQIGICRPTNDLRAQGDAVLQSKNLGAPSTSESVHTDRGLLMPGSQTEPNKALFKRFHDGINSDDPEVISRTIDELVAPDVAFHAPVPVPASGAQALKMVMTVLHQAYPDLHVSVEDVIAEGDKVVGRNVVTGTNRGELMGRPPTGKGVRYNEIFIFRFAGGRIVEIWGVVDVLSQLQQLGLMAA